MVVAWDIIPLAIFMPNHHHAVLTGGEEAVGLVRPPVFILLKQEKIDELFEYEHSGDAKSTVITTNDMVIMT